jgi:hypothetical protein
MILGNMNASTEEAMGTERADFEAIVLIVLLPSALSRLSALIGSGVPLNQEDTESPMPACRKRSSIPLKPPPCSLMQEKRPESSDEALPPDIPNLFSASFKTPSITPMVKLLSAETTALGLS